MKETRNCIDRHCISGFLWAEEIGNLMSSFEFVPSCDRSSADCMYCEEVSLPKLYRLAKHPFFGTKREQKHRTTDMGHDLTVRCS